MSIFDDAVPQRPLVIIESPYRGDVERNVAYARACVRDSLRRKEAPVASHLLYTQPGILDDDIPGERRLGIEAGHAWLHGADTLAAYTQLGITTGMRERIERAYHTDVQVVYRSIDPAQMVLAGIQKRGSFWLPEQDESHSNHQPDTDR